MTALNIIPNALHIICILIKMKMLKADGIFKNSNSYHRNFRYRGLDRKVWRPRIKFLAVERQVTSISGFIDWRGYGL